MPGFDDPYEAVLADLIGKRDEIDAAIEVVRKVREIVRGNVGLGIAMANGGLLGDSEDIQSDSFFGLTIADAAVKFLSKWANRKAQSTNVIIDALERGGLKKSKYTTVYSILTRRAKKERDVVNVKGDWGLASWYLGGAPASKPSPRRVSMKPSTFVTDESATQEEAIEKAEEIAAQQA